MATSYVVRWNLPGCMPDCDPEVSDVVLAARIVKRLLSLDGMHCTIDLDPDSTYPREAWEADLIRHVCSEIRLYRATYYGGN